MLTEVILIFDNELNELNDKVHCEIRVIRCRKTLVTSKKVKRLKGLLIGSLFVGLAAQAQVRSYDVLKRSDAWLTSVNAAALTRYSADNAAQAELSLTKAKGGFTDFSGSPDVLQGDAAVEAFYRLSSRTVVFGSMSYDNFSGKDMAGSAFISDHSTSAFISPLTSHLSLLSRHLPFDIIEDSLNNTGTKHHDTYRLKGAFGYSVSDGFAVGASLDYTAANYAKYKDLRHKNKLMDMTFTAGLYAPLGSSAQIGAAYLYRRTTESLSFSTYGKGDRNYVSFINYGPYIGQVEQFGSVGFTDKGHEMPLVDDIDGVSLQFSLSPYSFLLFYNSFTYAHRRGYYKRCGANPILFTRHKSHIYHYDARLSHQSEKARYFLDFSLNAENLVNRQPGRRELKNDAGATYYEYTDPVKTANRLWVDGQLSLRADVGRLFGATEVRVGEDTRHPVALTVPGSMSAWSIEGGLSWAHPKQTAYLFPYYRRQRYTSYEPFVSLTRNIATRSGVWTVQATASFRHGVVGNVSERYSSAIVANASERYNDGTLGSVPHYYDGTFIEPSDKQTPPATMDTYFWRNYQWMNAAQYAVGASAQYSFIMPSTSMKTYLRVALSHRKCNERNEYTAGPDRTTATLTLGCEL